MRQMLLTFGLTLLLVVMALPMNAQVVNNDNEDQVIKLNADRSKYDCVPGQVLVKFKDENRIQVNASRGQFRSTSNNRLTQVLQKFGAEDMEQLLPQKEGTTFKARRTRAYNGETIVERDLSQLYRVKLKEERAQETMQLIDELKHIDEVEFAEPNYILHTLEDVTIEGITGSNPLLTSQWYLQDYGVTTLWTKPIINHTRPVIAIIDTGVDMTHPDLAPNIWTNPGEMNGEKGYDNDGNGFKNDLHGWDFINNTPNVRDFNMHGTHVAGIAAAANNNIGIIGANPRALIMPVSVLQSDGSGDVATVVKGINYAVKNGATVLNLSLGTYANSRALRQALENAYGSAVIVAAAGNDNICINSTHHPVPCYGAAPMFPAAYSFVLGVQATQELPNLIKGGYLTDFTNYDDDGQFFSAVTTYNNPDGFNYELEAPGSNMLSTIPGGKYKVLNGTSMAAPLVAGAISLLTMVKDYTKDNNQIYQEILWGDLLHTKNIAQAYAVTNRPAELDLMKIQYHERKELANETEEDYGGDGEIDAGETVSLYPVIRTTFGAASNIKMKLEMGDEFEDPNIVEILTPGWVDFGLHLDAYGKGVSLNPMQLRVASDVPDNRHIKMKFIAKCDETNIQYVGTFTLKVSNMVKISGLISEDMTLIADHVYLVNDNIGIMEGATLTIEPGTRLEFEQGMGISSYGKLVAKGTPDKPIVFTNHVGGDYWTGIMTHESTGIHSYQGKLYTNNEQNLFTLLPTEQTPNVFPSNGNSSITKHIWYSNDDETPIQHFYLSNYIEDMEGDIWSGDMTSKQHLLTDPNYLTSTVLQAISDYNDYCSRYAQMRSDENQNSMTLYFHLPSWKTYDNPRDTIAYCILDGYGTNSLHYPPYMHDCILMPNGSHNANNTFYRLSGVRNVIKDIYGFYYPGYIEKDLKYSNIVNCYERGITTAGSLALPTYSQLSYNNYFNNFYWRSSGSDKYYGKEYAIGIDGSIPTIDHAEKPSYLGTSREDIIRPYIFEIGNADNTYGRIDLSNMRTTPIPEAHGIVWKVVVNGKDAQDEYEDLAPLGVGKHKFEVYFNRPMNKNVVPQISFGVRDPWTQNAVAEEGEGSGWNEEGTIYTAYKTITGKTKSDGVNRIYVRGAEDDEYFEIPYEKTRFNIQINAAGSMATGFAAEAKMGRVNLTWDNTNNDFEDAMGFNVYRYNAEAGEETAVCLNQEILDVTEEEYVDYDVTPGETYCYYYKVLSTDLQEYDVSNVVAATPLTATLGDADGSGDVKVGDVITTVNYILGEDPKPFIFEAADMNSDQSIDVLDVIGIVQAILNQPSNSRVGIESVAEAVYTIEDGVLYIETPVTLSGLQIQVSTNEQPVATNEMKGFELASAWLTDSDYRLLAYSFGSKTLMPGKHAIMTLGSGELTSIRLSDTQGNPVMAVPGDATVIKDAMGSKVMNQQGVYNLNGQKVMGNADTKLRKGVHIINGEKVIK